MPLSCARAGSLFSLEVLHRTGLQFYEVATYAVGTGVVCLAVFRGLKLASFGAVWSFDIPFVTLDSRHIVLGESLCCVCAMHAAAPLYSALHACFTLSCSPWQRQHSLPDVAATMRVK